MGFVGDFFDDITGKTAQEEAERAAQRAQQQAEQDRVNAQNEAASARTFAETEGQGRGSIGQVSLGLDDDELETDVKKKSNLFL